jgi:NIMA (never in mitosis gene a)-related kinase
MQPHGGQQQHYQQQQQPPQPQQHQALRATLNTPPSSLQGGSRPSSAGGVPLVNPFEEFESLGVIGRGKYSEVHRARSRRTGELVAVKKVSIFEMDSDGRREVVNEANILQALPPHAHIIKYLHSYLYNNDLYLILELAESGDISLLLEQQRRKGSYFQEAEIWHYFVQIADALHAMHQCRVMHRDIKPANIFLTAAPQQSSAASTASAASSAVAAPASSSSSSSIASAAAAQGLHSIGLTIKLGDLGLGRYLSSKTYETFSMVGTPFYMRYV